MDLKLRLCVRACVFIPNVLSDPKASESHTCWLPLTRLSSSTYISAPFNPMPLYLPQFVCFSFPPPHPFICAAAALEQQTEPNNNNSLVAGKDPPGHDHNQATLASVWPPWACLSNWVEITNPPALLTLLSWMSKYLWASISISELQSHMWEKRMTGVRRCL